MPPKSLPEEFQFHAKQEVWKELRRFVAAVEARLNDLESQSSTFEEEVNKFEAVGLAALNDAIAPLVTQAIDRLTSVAQIFEASSPTEHTISTGAKEFLIPGEERLTFVATPYLAIYAKDADPAAGLVATLDSFDPITGELRVVVTQVEGAGTYDDWIIRVAAPSISGGATPAYVDSEIDAAVASLTATFNAVITSAGDSLRTELRGSPPAALNSIQKLAAAIGNDANFAGSMATALAGKIGANSPTFTGDPKAPTPPATDNDTSIATTAMVQAALTGFLSKTPIDRGTKTGGSWRYNPSGGPIQFVKNGGAHTILAPDEPGFVILYIENVSGAGAITWSGFEKALSGGDPLTTTVGHKFLVQMQSIVVAGGLNVQSYMIKALQ